jgi:hypothetical protein
VDALAGADVWATGAHPATSAKMLAKAAPRMCSIVRALCLVIAGLQVRWVTPTVDTAARRVVSRRCDLRITRWSDAGSEPSR